MFLLFICGLISPFVVLFIFIFVGGLPASTSQPPLPFERTFANFVIHRAMKIHPITETPLVISEDNLQAGVKVYLHNCSVCHGVPGKSENYISRGMFPKPPQLFLADQGVTDDSQPEIFWKIKNGIRLTGMPGFEKTLTSNEIWQVTQLVHDADKLPAFVLQALKN